MDLLSAKDQENLAHGHRTAAASKPSNQGLFKTPGPANRAPKTPFKIPLNDENAIQATGKGKAVNVKTNGKLFTNGKKGDGDKNAFVTPAGRQIKYCN